LERIGSVTVFSRNNGRDTIIDSLQGSTIAVLDGTVTDIDAQFCEAIPSLEYICLTATGYDEINLQDLQHLPVKISNVSDYATESVAELTLTFILTLFRKLIAANEAMHSFSFEIDFGELSHHRFLGNNLRGKTIGIIGSGNIGRRVAEIAHAMGMEVLMHAKKEVVNSAFEICSLKKILETSDVISLHRAFERGDQPIIDIQSIELIKKGAVIINTAREGLVDHDAIAKKIADGDIAGFASDVSTALSSTHPLFSMPNVILTPHLGFYTGESLEKLGDKIVANIEAFSNKCPINLINSLNESK